MAQGRIQPNPNGGKDVTKLILIKFNIRFEISFFFFNLILCMFENKHIHHRLMVLKTSKF